MIDDLRIQRCIHGAAATTYYVSSLTGNDHNGDKSTAVPLRIGFSRYIPVSARGVSQVATQVSPFRNLRPSCEAEPREGLSGRHPSKACRPDRPSSMPCGRDGT